MAATRLTAGTGADDVQAVLLPPTLILPPKRLPRLNLRELVNGRELLMIFCGREVKLRYRQTLLGAGWVVMAPTLTAAVFSVVFSTIAKLPSQGVPYFLFALVGMAAWTAFSNGLTKTSQALVNNAQLVTKIYFERLTLVLGTLLSTVVDIVIILIIVAGVMAAYQVLPGPQLLALPFLFAALFVFAGGLGMLAGAFMVSYRDLVPIVTLGTQILLYVSPVGYGLAAIPPHLRHWFEINPLVGLIGAIRWSLIGTSAPSSGLIAYSVAVSLVCGVLGLAVFRYQERRFADVI